MNMTFKVNKKLFIIEFTLKTQTWIF